MKKQIPQIIPEPKPVIINNDFLMCGGTSKSAPATQEIKDYLQKNLELIKKNYLEEKNVVIEKVEALSFRKKTIDGYLTFIKTKINDGEIVQVTINEHHSGTIRGVFFSDLE